MSSPLRSVNWQPAFESLNCWRNWDREWSNIRTSQQHIHQKQIKNRICYALRYTTLYSLLVGVEHFIYISLLMPFSFQPIPIYLIISHAHYYRLVRFYQVLSTIISTVDCMCVVCRLSWLLLYAVVQISHCVWALTVAGRYTLHFLLSFHFCLSLPRSLGRPGKQRKKSEPQRQRQPTDLFK